MDLLEQLRIQLTCSNSCDGVASIVILQPTASVKFIGCIGRNCVYKNILYDNQSGVM